MNLISYKIIITVYEEKSFQKTADTITYDTLCSQPCNFKIRR